jgi:hypothetical protein
MPALSTSFRLSCAASASTRPCNACPFRSYYARVDPDAGDVATKEAREACQATCATHLERLDGFGEQLNERIESIVGVLPAAVVLPDGRICLALKAAGSDSSSHVRPPLREPNQIARLR